MTERGAEPEPLLAEAFGRADITRLRHTVEFHAATAGLEGQRLGDFVLAVNEIITNAVRYADGRGELRLWATDSTLCCEIRDTGGGIPADRVAPPRPPSASAAGGRGIWLARQLCDRLTVDTGAHGTTVCVSTGLDADAAGELSSAGAGCDH
jgi:anti-sigma regulatory factor (Ser/Thr protein kinase)